MRPFLYEEPGNVGNNLIIAESERQCERIYVLFNIEN